ncbi:hypothetical protein EF919_18140 [Streptomyces sp. WAC02707]|uniref:hypothetical protein n=1 Tax=Streptomyces TaxID=1883 RepID=UPI000F79BB92|nr:hypothetical protein [Streptomyces sp. WAC02707]RSS92454.1 hypothetical protein EF919_18140 [Streptomyces sp. WAC02707]
MADNLVFKASGLTLSSSSDHITANVTNGTTGRVEGIDISTMSNGLLVVHVGNAPTGTAPTLSVFFDVADEFGNWVLTSNATAISGAAMTSSGYTYGQITSGYTLSNRGRIRWTLGGTNPSFTGVGFSLYGRR